MTSLRARVLVGAALWTVGLLAAITILFTFYREAMDSLRIVHESTHTAGIVAIACMVVGFAVVRGAIRPLEAIRRRLADVQKGTVRELPGAYPSEIQPLVDDLNALLAHHERIVTRANARAGDLAHGLKTPLAVLANEAGRLTDRDLAATITQQVMLMRRQVDYHLAHARAAAAGAPLNAACAVAESVDALCRTMQRLHADRGVRIDVAVDPAHALRVRREDLDEMLGNLLDNACKWASSRVSVTSSRIGDRIAVVVDDDGPGLAPSLREEVLQRGVRADEAAPGSGLGLAIVRDISGLYGGAIALDSSPHGGLRATLTLP